MRVCVYAIAKNEEQFVDRFVAAASEADLILVADTGSTDNTVGWLAHPQNNVVVHQIGVKPWRFDIARNAALALVPDDIDVCVSLDLDEELQPGWRQEIERVWKSETTRLRYLFDWGLGIAFWYEKIHARWGYKWHHPCHEYPMPYGINEVWAQTSDDFLMVVHKPDSTKSRAQYLDLLKLSVEEDPYCPRNAFYYARELSFVRKWVEAIIECRRYLALPRATWANERCYAYRVIGRCYNELGNREEAFKAFTLATSEAPNTREPWFELAWLMYDQGRWPQCFAYASIMLSIDQREKVYTVDPKVWGAPAHDVMALACYQLGMYQLAAQHGHLAQRLEPMDPRYGINQAFYMEKLKCSDTPQSDQTPSAKKTSWLLRMSPPILPP